jgi:hypothetical protein
MNQEARAELDRILSLEPAALTDADRAFLSARRDYLSEDQKAVYGVSEAPVVEASEAEEAPKPKKTK